MYFTFIATGLSDKEYISDPTTSKQSLVKVSLRLRKMTIKSAILLMPLIFGSALALQFVRGTLGCDKNEEGKVLLLFQIRDHE